MTWTKLSDDWTDDTWTLSDAAYRLHADALVWSNRKLLDLQIPKDDVARISKGSTGLQELLDGSWWLDAGDHYLIQHHAMYQPTREQVLKRQQANRTNGKRGGRPGRERKTQPVSDSQSHSVSERAGQPTHPAPVTPVEMSHIQHPETQSLSESLTHGDGTGRDWKDSLKRAGTNDTGDLESIAHVIAIARKTGCAECQRRAAFANAQPCPDHEEKSA